MGWSVSAERGTIKDSVGRNGGKYQFIHGASSPRYGPLWRIQPNVQSLLLNDF